MTPAPFPRPLRTFAAAVAVTVGIASLAACGGDSDGSSAPTTVAMGSSTTPAGGGGAGSTISVPGDHETIQAAVDAAKPGDLILIDEGVYNEAVDVTTDDLTIRGVDRNEVVLDGEFTLENGIRVLDADGVVVENMTARNYTTNGFFWTGSDRYRGSYLTAYRNGDYGVYAFDAYDGQFDNSLGSGSPDAGFYIGECYKCNAVLDNVISEYNGLGYSGTNSGGDLFIVNSTFRYNRAGIVPNSGSYELCYPGRETTIVGNIVHDNNNLEAPAISVALMAHGNGILLAGAIDSTVERNLVFDHDRGGIIAVPFPEEDASDVPPPAEEHSTPCEETRDAELPDPETIPDMVIWHPTGNVIRGNVVSGSGLADLGSGTLDLDGSGTTTADLENCFADNEYGTTAPTDLEGLAPCEGEGNGGDFEAGSFDLVALIAEQPEAVEDSWKTMPVPEPQPSMPDARTAPVVTFTGPTRPDLDAIKVPAKP
jgi:hypothetical protein